MTTHSDLWRDPTRRPPIARDPIPEDLVNFRPAVEFSLDEALFARTLRSARRGAAGGPSGMTYEHLRRLLDNPRDVQRFHQLGERFARAEVSQPIVDAVRIGRITALRKSDGGVRGIVAGDLFRRLVSRTIAKQLAKEVEAATAPFQYALSTRAGCECVAHVIQGLCEMNPTATITSIDGISAYDSISRRAMLQGFHHLDEGSRVLPFVRLFHGTPSSYLWEDDSGTVHRIRQGEGGEQGDALMPLLFSLGQHGALQAAQEQLRPQERLMAFLDDVYMVSQPERVGSVYAVLQEKLFAHAGIRVHGRKTKVWKMAGVRPASCDVLEQIARNEDPRAVACRGSGLDSREQGIKILGIPVGHHDFVTAFWNGSQQSTRHCLSESSSARCPIGMALVAPLRASSSELLASECSAIIVGPFCCKTRQQSVALFA